jgi:GAF domain-containing protein
MGYLETMGTFARLAEPHAKHPGEPGRLAEEQAALRRVATLVAAGAQPAEVFDAVTAEVAALIPADSSALTRYEADGTFTSLSGWAIEGAHKYVGRRFEREGTVSGLVFETGRPGRLDSYAEAPGEASEVARELAWQSSVGAPITVEGRLWGALVVVSKSDRPLPPETERRLAEFTELVATAIANSQAHDDLTRLAEEQAALRRVATLVAAGASPAEVFEAVSAEVAALIHADGSALTRYEEDGTVTALSGWTSEGGYRHVGTRYPLEGTVSGVIFETGRPGRVANYAEAPGKAPEAAREMGWHSSVGAPITVGGRLWGALAVASRREKALPPDAEQRLAAFTELVATAIANTEAHQQLARLADEQAALRRVATLAAQGVPPGEVFEAVSAEVAQLVGADGAGVTRYEADGTFTALGGSTTSGDYSYSGRRFPLEGSVSGLVLETRRTSRIDDFEGRPGEAAAAIREEGWRSAMGAPILVEGSLWGVLVVYSKRTEPLPPDTERRLGEFTEIVATAIANAEGREEINRLAEVQAALRRVATMVARGAKPADVFEAVSAEVGRLVPADAAALARYESDGTATLLGGWTRAGGFHLRVGDRFSVDLGTSARAVFDTSRSARVDSYAEASAKVAERARAAGWRASVAAPIIVEGALWGFVTVASTSDRPLPADTEERLADFTDLVATAIANAEGREELRVRSDEQAALRRVATLVARGVPAAEIFDAVAAEVVRLLGADWAAVERVEPDGAVTVASSYGVLKEEIPVGARARLDSEGLIASVMRTGSSARLESYEDGRGDWGARAQALGIRSTVGAPITVERRIWGVMVAAWTQEGRVPFIDAEARMANFTELVGTAIANAESRAELDASRARIVATADATRRRIERDLHDGAQQQLVSLALEVRAAQAGAPEEMGKHRDDLSRIAEGLTTVLDGLREIALGIHPAILAEGGLGPALKTLAHRSPIPVELDVRDDGRSPEPVEVAAYYVVSEALTNAAKHSRASKLQIDVDAADRGLRVAVRDDGVGGADPALGSGLLGLKDRAEAIGGTITLESRQGMGTTLIAELPHP